MKHTACSTVHRLTVQHCTDPNTAGLLKKLVKKTINLKIASTKAKLTFNLIDRLTRKNIGVNEVEEASKTMIGRGGRWMGEKEKEKERKRFVAREIRVRKVDAMSVLHKTKHKFEKNERYLVSRLLQLPALLTQVRKVRQEEVVSEWREGSMKLLEKVKHLERKWGRKRRVVPGIWNLF